MEYGKEHYGLWSRPPLARMLHIHEALQEEAYPSAVTLARSLEVSRKTVQRDVDFMRDRLGLPIEYNPSRRGYYYTEAVSHFPTFTVTEGELFALLVARKALEAYQGTPFQDPLEQAFLKLAEGLKDHVSFSMEALDAPVSFKPIGISMTDEELFRELSCAVMRQEEVRFDYRKLNSDLVEKRHVQPYHLVHIDNQWYVITYDLMRQAMRTFALPRIDKLIRLDKRFERPDDFDAKSYLKNSFGVFSGEVKYAVGIRFDAFATRLIKEKTWHPGQQIVELEDERCELWLRLPDLREIERWVLSWGDHAEVIEPEALRQRIKSVAGKLAAIYDKT